MTLNHKEYKLSNHTKEIALNHREYQLYNKGMDLNNGFLHSCINAKSSLALPTQEPNIALLSPMCIASMHTHAHNPQPPTITPYKRLKYIMPIIRRRNPHDGRQLMNIAA